MRVTTGTALTFQNRGLSSYPTISKSLSLMRLDLSHNPLTDFRGMVQYASLRHLIASNTKIQSFAGAVAQPDLEELNLLNTPLGSEPYFWTMALIVFGETVTVLNGQPVVPSQWTQVYALRPAIELFLRDGWILKRAKPLTLLNPTTRARKVLYALPVPRLRPTSALASPPRTPPSRNSESRKSRRSRTRSPTTPPKFEAEAPPPPDSPVEPELDIAVEEEEALE